MTASIASGAFRQLSIALLATAAIAAGPSLVRASLPEQLAACQEDARPEAERIAACTAVLQSKGEPDGIYAEALLNRGFALEGLGKQAEALSDYDQAARLNPEYPAIFNYRGALHEAMGKSDLAIADFTSSIRLDAKEGYPYSRRGRLLAEKGDLAAALKDLDTAISLDAQDATALVARGAIHERQGRPEAALRDYRRALAIEADNEEAQAGVERLRGA